MTSFSEDRIVLYIHGSTQASETTFDLALDGISWMDDLAKHGWDVWLMDLRGFGRSTKPAEMDRPPADNPPIAPAEAAVRDVAAAVEHIRNKRGVPRISLIGWSRGQPSLGCMRPKKEQCSAAGLLCAWLGSHHVCCGGSSNAHRCIPNLDSGAGASATSDGSSCGRRDNLMPPRWVEAWSTAVLATDPIGAARTPPVVRTPAGTVQDGREYWQAGKALYDPERITAPTLLL